MTDGSGCLSCSDFLPLDAPPVPTPALTIAVGFQAGWQSFGVEVTPTEIILSHTLVADPFNPIVDGTFTLGAHTLGTLSSAVTALPAFNAAVAAESDPGDAASELIVIETGAITPGNVTLDRLPAA